MSRADWTFLEHLLEEGQEFSTGIGRVWLTVLFLFRILVLATAAESAWDDEQLDFVCNTLQPGCTAVCYDKAFPISHFRYFTLQIIFVSTPTIFYFGYVALRARKAAKEEEGKDEEQAGEGGGGSKRGEIVITRITINKNVTNEEKQEDGGKGRIADKAPPEVPKLKGRLLCAYAFSILVKVLLEAGFSAGLWFLYGGFFIEPKFECTRPPCPYTVDCFVSRPTEKTIFTIYTQVIAAVSLVLNLVELLHLLQLAISQRVRKALMQPATGLPISGRADNSTGGDSETQNRGFTVLQSRGHADLPIQGATACCPNPCESYRDLAIEVNWEPGETGSDLLPSYVNCMGAMRKTHSPRANYKKHANDTGKNTKSVYKGHSKQKHYV